MRNLVVRSLSGAVFLAIVISSLLLDKFMSAAMLLFIMVVMMHEFYAITMGKKYMVSRCLALLCAISLFASAFLFCCYGIPAKWLAVAILPLVAMVASSIHFITKENFFNFAFLYAGLLYVALPVSGANLLLFNNGEFNGLLLLCFLGLIWASDVGAYVFGISFGQKPGRKKLCPSISPKKSWVGFWGGLFTTVVTGVIFGLTGLFDFPLVHCVVLSLVMGVAAVYGDLFESQWKRCYDVKDSGNIMPGHGGLLDRFDSAVVAIPAGALYLLAAGIL